MPACCRARAAPNTVMLTAHVSRQQHRQTMVPCLDAVLLVCHAAQLRASLVQDHDNLSAADAARQLPAAAGGAARQQLKHVDAAVLLAAPGHWALVLLQRVASAHLLLRS